MKMDQALTNSEPKQMVFAEMEALAYTNSYNASQSRRQEIEERFGSIIREGQNLGSLVSYVGNKNFPFLRLYKYKEAFSFSLVRNLLARFAVDIDDYVFDPFAGLGTTLFTSMINGIPSIGIDKLPIAYFIAKTLPLFFSLDNGELRSAWSSIIPKIKKVKLAEVALDVLIMKVAFQTETFEILRKLKSAIDEQSNPYRDTLLFLFFSILEECSFTSKEGQFLRLKRDKKTSDPIEAMDKKVAQIEEDILKIKTLFPDLSIRDETKPNVYIGDARDLSNIKFKKKPTIIITSPPYVNRYDYTRTYSLELCFHFVRKFEELKAIRFGILRSHIESKIQKDEMPSHPVIREVVAILNRKELNNPKIPSMITAYFIDMEKVIREWARVLDDGAKVAMVVDNVRFEGELIPVDLVLSSIAEDNGFKTKEIIVARYKGNSSQQMKKYGRVPVRESIVIWEK